MKKIIKAILTFNFLILTFPPIVQAVSMYSPQYNIESANINDAAGNKYSEGYRLSDTIGQLAAGEFLSQGYVIKAGFQYTVPTGPFRFTVGKTKIDLGEIKANTPKTDSTSLTVQLGSVPKYQVTAGEQGPLTTLSGVDTIADTVCNGRSDSCNESQAEIWSLNSAYGFGYGLSGQDIPSDFIGSQYYRPFPDSSRAESPVVIMSGSRLSGKKHQSAITFKVNVSPLQAAGTYQTIISFVATPTY